MASPQGGAITLVLQHQPNGRLSGRLSGSGAEFSVEGMVEEGTAMGAMTSPQGRVFFEAVLDGDRLRLTLIEVGAGNMPDYDKTRTLALQRTGGEAVRLDADGGLESVLQGQAYAYSSTPDGGYSTLRKFYFDGAGRFLYGTETSFSVESGFGYNLQNNAGAGLCRVTGIEKDAEIHLRFPDGTSDVAYVYHTDGSRIYEIVFRRQLCGAALRQ